MSYPYRPWLEVDGQTIYVWRPVFDLPKKPSDFDDAPMFTLFLGNPNVKGGRLPIHGSTTEFPHEYEDQPIHTWYVSSTWGRDISRESGKIAKQIYRLFGEPDTVNYDETDLLLYITVDNEWLPEDAADAFERAKGVNATKAGLSIWKWPDNLTDPYFDLYVADAPRGSGLSRAKWYKTFFPRMDSDEAAVALDMALEQGEVVRDGWSATVTGLAAIDTYGLVPEAFEQEILDRGFELGVPYDTELELKRRLMR